MARSIKPNERRGHPITPAPYDPKATASHLASAPGYIMPSEEEGHVRSIRELDVVCGLAARSFNPSYLPGIMMWATGVPANINHGR